MGCHSLCCPLEFGGLSNIFEICSLINLDIRKIDATEIGFSYQDGPKFQA